MFLIKPTPKPARFDHRNDRRRSCRYPAATRDATLGWMRGDEAKQARVQIVDVSMLGCRVISHQPLPAIPGESVWLQILSIEAADWIEGAVRGSDKPFFGKPTVRVEFADPLPFQTFKTLVYGANDNGTRPLDLPEHETDTYWR